MLLYLLGFAEASGYVFYPAGNKRKATDETPCSGPDGVAYRFRFLPRYAARCEPDYILCFNGFNVTGVCPEDSIVAYESWEDSWNQYKASWTCTKSLPDYCHFRYKNCRHISLGKWNCSAHENQSDDYLMMLLWLLLL